MKKILCLIIAFALLLPGCAGSQDTAEVTEKRPGWTVVMLSETGENLHNDIQADEDFVLDEDEDPENIEAEHTGGDGYNISGGMDAGSSDSDSAAGISENLSVEQRREVVAAEMRAMMTLLWTPDRDITYTITGLSAGSATVSLKKGTIYQGMPYTNGTASRESFLSYATAQNNGVYTISGLTADSLSGNAVPRIGNSCSSALFWAWAKVSNSISFTNTKMMTETYGCLKVGNYTFDGKDYGSNKSADICAENGEQVMFAAYAQMQMADGMVRRTGSAGHAIMVVDVKVSYKADGTIDGKNSTATIIDQSETNELNPTTTNISGVGEVVIFQTVDKVQTFAQLYKNGYLPVTCKELVNSSPLQTATVTDCTDSPNVDNMFTGTIQANYRVSSVVVTITDKTGKTVQQAICYGKPSELYKFNLSRFVSASEQPAIQGKVDVAALPAGTYQCKYTCKLSTGDSIMFRQFTIQK